MLERIYSPGAPKAIGPYNQAIRAGDFLFCSGQIPLDPQTGELVAGDVSAQTRRVMENIRAVLAAASVTFANVAKTTIYLVDMNDLTAVNEIYGSYFSIEAGPFNGRRRGASPQRPCRNRSDRRTVVRQRRPL